MNPPAAPPPLLEVRDIEKRFAGVHALRGVSLTLARGEVLAVVGENGAGKSTLMKILAGVLSPGGGSIRIDGQSVNIESCGDAMRRGIVLIHQELNLADNLDIGSNIFLGREPLRFGLIDRAEINRQSRVFLEKVGLELEPTTIVKDLSVGRQQMVEIAKALSVGARVLIMDEPTSSLSTRESERLFEVVNDLRQQGVSIIYISHRLREVELLADRAVVLRDGANAGTLAKGEINHDNLVKLMVGRNLDQFYARQSHQPGQELLRVENLVTPEFPQQRISFSLCRGEIVGLAGLVVRRADRIVAGPVRGSASLGGPSILGWSASPVELPRRRHSGWPCPGTGGSQAAWIDLGNVGPAECEPAWSQTVPARPGVFEPPSRSRRCSRDDRTLVHQDTQSCARGAIPVRRQPAKSCHRQMVGTDPTPAVAG